MATNTLIPRHISNGKRKRFLAAAAKAERTRKPRRSKHALFQGDPHTPGPARGSEAPSIEPARGPRDPSATPASITVELTKVHAVNAEHRYFEFHHQRGATLRAKYRP